MNRFITQPALDRSHAIDERRRALARIAHNLEAAHDHLMLARSIDTQFALGLDLPSERPLVDAIAAAAVKLRGETAE